MDARPSLSLPEWLVLALLSQRPMHGFAIAQLTASGGELGRIWQVPEAVIYRAIGRLLDAGLIAPEGTEPGLGPQRTVYAATPRGRQATQIWLRTPVRHVRDIRSHLLLKLALLHRVGEDPAILLRRQREIIESIARAIEARRSQPGTGAELGRTGIGSPADMATAAGRRFSELAGRHLKRVHLELGGNSALVVLDDADLERAASVGAWESFLHQGQICMTTGRHLVHEAVYDDYVAALAAKADHLPVGDPASGQVALGPVIDERQRDKVHALVTATTGAGAKLAAGGTYEGLFYRPSVLADVAPDMPAYANEVFGPVAPVLRFGCADDIAELAARSEYGLSLGILTRDVMRGLDLARRITTGIVHINEQTVDDEANTPFGGTGDSGTGARFGGSANLDAFTETRWITMRGDIAPYPF